MFSDFNATPDACACCSRSVAKSSSVSRGRYSLYQVARRARERHRHLEFARRVKAEVHVLPQQVRREGDLEIEVHERGVL